MDRHDALIGLSHDHHHALVEARRLHRAADADEDPADAAAAFVRFFRTSSVPHFREEEESIFPLVATAADARRLLVEALLDHQRLHALTAALDVSVADGARHTMRELAERLEAHVRLEERRLFPLIESLAGDALDHRRARGRGGPVWGTESKDLNATLLDWPAGSGPPEHVNDERDVLVFVVDGTATLVVNGEPRALAAGDATIVAKGCVRGITAGRGGVRYLSVHLRRPPLQIGRGTSGGRTEPERDDSDSRRTSGTAYPYG